MLPAEAASRAAAREQFRHDVTRLWRGLLDAQQGDVAVRGSCGGMCFQQAGSVTRVGTSFQWYLSKGMLDRLQNVVQCTPARLKCLAWLVNVTNAVVTNTQDSCCCGCAAPACLLVRRW
jgi:hypothetical protein